MERFVCIHGHFYQPPRENPWLESIELQDSAHPYHDWNARITAECYAPNAAARVVSEDGRILEILNNYTKISYNFGPTLLSWMEKHDRDTYDAIIQADRESRNRFSGHGSALAQVYNHIIMPLANERDKETQIVWGLEDFRRRFGREAEGMWLAETAADAESLDVLARNGVRFTILAPNQAHRIRPLDKPDGEWHDVSGNRIDPSRPYLVKLPDDRSITVFFYDGPISQAVAFEELLRSGEQFAGRLMSGFSHSRNWNQLLHIATDGETYGHHHRFGDMALAYALHYMEEQQMATLTIYGEYLDKFPAEYEAVIFDKSSWSCAHGVERWRSDCGCSSGRAGWNQIWRGPVREALDWLRDEIVPHYESLGQMLYKDPWAARNAYISVILDRSAENVDTFLMEQGSHPLNEDEQIVALKLMELQRHALLMYTSCGWFFDELSGIETVQVIQYAGRCVQLASELFNVDLETGFLERLMKANSNIAEHQNGKVIYERFVKPSMVDLAKVGAHYAITSLFIPEQGRRLYAFDVEREDVRMWEAGHAHLLVGHARITSQITRESQRLTFGVLHFGDHNITGGVRGSISDEAFEELVNLSSSAFKRSDLAECIRVLDKQFFGITYTLKTLFKDEQRRILDMILQQTLHQASANMRIIFESHAPLMNYLKDLGAPQPEVLRAAAKFALSADLRAEIERGVADPPRVRALLEDARNWDLDLDRETMAYSLKQALMDKAEAFYEHPLEIERLRNLLAVVEIARELPEEASLWHPQNLFYEILNDVYPDVRDVAATGDSEAREWIEAFHALGERLMVQVE